MGLTTFYGDLETYCESPIKHGTYQYAEKCEPMLFQNAIDDSSVDVWDMTFGGFAPDQLVYAIEIADEYVFQNSMFDRSVIRLAPGFIDRIGANAWRQITELERWRDTMVGALAHSLPGGLEKLCAVLKVPLGEAKLARGKELIQLFCKPRPKNQALRRATRETHPVEWAELVEYAVHDILAMRVIWKKCPRWNYRGSELALWHLDQRVNDRGFFADLELAHAAIRAADKEKKVLKAAGQEATGYCDIAGTGVESLTQRDKLLFYLLEEYGVDLPDMKKDTLERRIDDPDLPIELRNLLSLRLMASTASVSKYATLVRGVSSDGRVRGTMQFDGAQRTGRWAHRLFQPGNMPRPDMEGDEIEQGIAAIKNDCVDLLFDNPMRVLSNAIRGLIIAPPGRKLVVRDLSNIEGREGAWLTGEDWKLRAFRDYDTIIGYDEKGKPIRKGVDLYIRAYCEAFNVHPSTINVKTIEGYLKRQIGKVMELMLQYQGGVGAFITGAETYGIDLEEMAKAALPIIPAWALKEAKEFYEWTLKRRRSTFGLSYDVFVACDALKRLWRRAHPAISSYWGEMEDVARKAIWQPGHWYDARRIAFRRDGAWLKMRLPSGRYLCYPSPQVDEKNRISYMGVNQYSRKWQRIHTYGGKIFENADQASSRDTFAHGVVLADEEGFDTLMLVHDEDITEVDEDSDLTSKKLGLCLTAGADWMEGLPLASSGFESHRYGKKD